MTLSNFARLGFGFVLASAAATSAIASMVPVTISANTDIYNAAGGSFGGANPVAIPILAGSPNFTFALSPAGQTIITNVGSGSNPNDADGFRTTAQQGLTVSATSNLSGIKAATSGFLVGVFLGPTINPTAPTSLDYTAGGNASTTALTYRAISGNAIQLQQVFFIGDGLTGDGTGMTQQFYIPTGATSLYLGFADASGYNGSPGSFDDNVGSFAGTITFRPNASFPVTDPTVPEPASIGLVGIGLVGLTLARRRKSRR